MIKKERNLPNPGFSTLPFAGKVKSENTDKIIILIFNILFQSLINFRFWYWVSKK